MSDPHSVTVDVIVLKKRISPAALLFSNCGFKEMEFCLTPCSMIASFCLTDFFLYLLPFQIGYLWAVLQWSGVGHL
jgi:hypothetical protein